MTKLNMKIIDSDVLIVGSGVGGLRAALEVAKGGKKPLLVSKSPIGKSNNTYLAGGNFACSTESFSADEHMKLTLKSGKGLNDLPLVKTLVREAPALVKELNGMGLNGTLHERGVASRGSTLVGGREINRTLVKLCQDAGVQFLEDILITNLITDRQACFGAIGFHRRTGAFYGFQSRAVLLATGGAGAIYAQNDNAPGITGDGYVLGLEAGLELKDLEFVQFYPLAYAGAGRARMIIPPFFADLGRVTNRLGEDLKEKYDLREKPLAIVARDRFSRALFKEISEGNGIDGALLLDVRGVEEAEIPLSDSLKDLFKQRIAYHSKPIRISPTSHHFMGGLVIDNSGRTALDRLFAAGEVAGGLHGADRMGGNGLSDALVFGTLAARSALDCGGTSPSSTDFKALSEDVARNIPFISSGENRSPSKARALMGELKEILWETVGIIRNEGSLTRGLVKIDWILEEIQKQQASNPADLSKIMECKTGALTARAIAVSALKRTESRGSHHRDDFPEEREEWAKHIHVRLIDGIPDVVRTTDVSQ